MGLGEPDTLSGSGLLERDGEIAALAGALDATRAGGDGRVVLIEGPPGIGKTALLEEFVAIAAERGASVLRARGTEMEREFGYGVVRTLLGPTLHGADAAERERRLAGPAGLAAGVFGLAEPGAIDVVATEASLYGLYWLLADAADAGPLVLAIDDAHWSDVASLRFVRYLSRRLEGLPVLVVLAARPAEPGAAAEALRELTAELDEEALRPALLSEAGTAALLADAFESGDPALAGAAHEATGGNPLLIATLLAELSELPSGEAAALGPERIATLGSARLAAAITARAGRLDPRAGDVAGAVAVLGEGSDLGSIATLAGLDRGAAAALLDGLAAASILGREGTGHGFVHPLLRGAFYESIAPAARAETHARAAALLRERGAAPEAIAAHLLLCEPTRDPAAATVLEEAARLAAARGAHDSVVTYLTRALAETTEPTHRADVLHTLARSEIALRDPAAIGHLSEAAALSADPERALDVYLELVDLYALAGFWTEAVAAVETALERFGDTGLPALLDLEAGRAASRGYHPDTAAEYAVDRPRLRQVVAGRVDDDSSHLRWTMAGLGALGDLPRDQVLELVGPSDQHWGMGRRGRESPMIGQAAWALLLVDDLEKAEQIATVLDREARERGSTLAALSSLGFRASLESRAGRLAAAEAQLAAAIELVRQSELNLMALTTFLQFSVDTVVERPELDPIADLVDSLELPEPFGRTASGAMLLDVRAAVRRARGDRAGTLATLRECEPLVRALGFGPRYDNWRSQLALALPEDERDEALRLAAEEARVAAALGSPRAESVALRALGALRGGEEGIGLLERSVGVLADCPSPLERARSLGELGAALRRANRRGEAREQLREATEIAQRCGALRLERRLDEELRVAGGKPRRRALSGPDSLTPAEARVAAAAAGGATNREIGQQLFVSLRTVEMHLTNAYRKLDISSRAELAAAIDAGA
jgi:DNA-binding CsgD family transcriptional regulator